MVHIEVIKMVQSSKNKSLLIVTDLLLFLSAIFIPGIQSWSNGGYTTDIYNPKYGTHDWIAEHAKNWLPEDERKWIDFNLNYFLYGTEYPDNSNASYENTKGYGDTTQHHNYYTSSGFVTDNSSAIRAKTEYEKALTELKAGRNVTAAIYAGSMSHYIDDVAVFGHVLNNETHHSDYENYVEARTTNYSYGVFELYLTFDGKLETTSAYDASINLGRNTFTDDGGIYTANWMDSNYDWSSSVFKNRCGESLNLATNHVADVLHTLYVAAYGDTQTTTIPPISTGSNIVINEVEANPTGTDSGNEWVELYNPTSQPVNVGGWTLETNQGRTALVTIPSGTVINPDSYYVVTKSTQWLDNENDYVILRDSSGNEVDRSITFNDTQNNAFSWQRYSNGVDTNSNSDWSFRVSTRGSSNGVKEAPNPITYKLTITDPEGSGFTNPLTGAYNYNQITTVNVLANSAPGWVFDHWVLDGINYGNTNPININMNKNHVLKAVFLAVQQPIVTYKLTIQQPEGNGVTDPTSGNYVYDQIVNVPIKANPLTGWVFDHWLLDGVDIGNLNPYTLNMNANHTIQATFKQVQVVPTPKYVLTISGPEGSGSTNPQPGSYSYDKILTVTIQASPSSGWQFDHWLLDGKNIGAINPYTLNMNANHTLKAIFSIIPVTTYSLTIQKSGSGSTDPAQGKYTYNKGTNVNVNAIAASGWTFDHWELDNVKVGDSTLINFTMNSDHVLNAIFKESPSTSSGLIPAYPLSSILIGIALGLVLIYWKHHRV
jgi:hypothetical protein